MKVEPITKEQMDELLRFLPLFDVPGRAFFCDWAGGDKSTGGAVTMPYPVYPEDVVEFYRLAGQPWWSDYQYRPGEAAQMLGDEAYIRRATLDEIKTMLTYCVRGERFSDGHWGVMLEKGKITALLKRLQVLRDQGGKSVTQSIIEVKQIDTEKIKRGRESGRTR